MANGQYDYRLEAEDLKIKRGFKIEYDDTVGASGDAYLALAPQSRGVAKTDFQGEDGVYEIRLGYYDEADGNSRAMFWFDGLKTKERFDQSPGGNNISSNNLTELVLHDSIELKTGDEIKLMLRTLGLESGGIDYVDFIRIDVPPEPDTPPDMGSKPPSLPAPNPPAPPSADPPMPDTFGFFEQEVVRLTNDIRAQHGLNALSINSSLNNAAEGHSSDMATLDFFSHYGKDGSNPGERITDEGYSWRTYGENIAAGYDTPGEVVNAWYGSAGHRANMLNPNFNEIGVGFVEISPDTGSVNYSEYWTQVFAA